jgi:hypothetical protein
LLCLASSSALDRLICDFCSSDRVFAAGFFRIPPREGHPCLRLTIPAAELAADFHRLVDAHAGHTNTRAPGVFPRWPPPPVASLLPPVQAPLPVSSLFIPGPRPMIEAPRPETGGRGRERQGCSLERSRVAG